MTKLNSNYKTRRLSPTGKLILAEIIPALQSLKAGKSLLIQNNSPQMIDQIRAHLYTYLSETASKAYYRTVRESATALRVICQDFTPSKLSIEFSPIETFVVDNLLSCQSLDEASAVAQVALSAGEITDAEMLAILEEWERKCGSGEEAKPLGSQASIKPLNGSVEDGKGGE